MSNLSANPLQQSFLERENFLLTFVTENCLEDHILDVEKGWKVLDTYGIQIIERFLLGNAPPDEKDRPLKMKSFSSLHTISYKICVAIGHQDNTENLYDKYKKKMNFFLSTQIRDKMIYKYDMELLKEFVWGWNTHKLFTSYLWKLFMHIDKSIQKDPIENIQTITSCSLNMYYELVFRPIIARVRQVILLYILKDRNGEIVDKDILRNAIEVSMFCRAYFV